MYIYASPGQGGSRRRKQKKVCMQHAFLQRPDIPVRLQNEVLLRLLPMDFCTAEDACIMPLKNKSLRFPVNRASQTFILSNAASGILRHFRAQLEHSSFSRQQRSFFPLDAMQETVTFPVCRSPLDRAPGPWGGSFRRARECPRAVFRKAFRPRRPHRWPPGDSGQKHCRHRFQEALNA